MNFLPEEALSEQAKLRLLWLWVGVAALVLVVYEVAHFEGAFAQTYWALSNATKNTLTAHFGLAVFVLFRHLSHLPSSLNFIELIQKVISNGLFVFLLALIIKTVLFLAGTSGPPQAIVVVLGLLFYLVVVVYLASSFFVWKRLILYQKSKLLDKVWQFFEMVVLLAILFQLADLHFYDNVFLFSFGFISSLALLLSFNLRWVAYLNLRQKGQSLLLIVLSMAFLAFFYTELGTLSQSRVYRAIDLSGNLWLLSLFVFFASYGLISLLVVAFNLPTSSVFEQKFEDLLQYQRMNEIIELGQNEEEICRALLDGSQNSTGADAAWMDIFSESDAGVHTFLQNIQQHTIASIKQILFDPAHQYPVDKHYFENIQLRKLSKGRNTSGFQSALVVPLRTNKSDLGIMVLLKEVSEGFEKEMVNLVRSFTVSGAQSIQNTRLLKEEKEKERLQTQMEMAREVQKGLIPFSYFENDIFQIAAHYQSAHEIGGDYFDARILDHHLALVIGDVSGKGASAAINMAQMKGVFQSLILTEPDPVEFISFANEAMLHCLKDRSFITLLYLSLDLPTRRLQWVRAGHCPALHFRSVTGESTFLHSKGLALGILPAGKYEQHSEAAEIELNEGDYVMLFTDGIVEARSITGEEYGYDRIQAFVAKHAHLQVRELCNAFLEEVRTFTQDAWQDDYALVLLQIQKH
jgi:serine phosphatase RsbU (regulator of sigma subunit)